MSVAIVPYRPHWPAAFQTIGTQQPDLTTSSVRLT
jgi:hypothetical protein